MNSQTKGVTIWLTGLSGSGKTSIAVFLEQQLTSLGYKTEVLDGDVVRQYLSSGLGYSKQDRDENIRRIGFVSHLLTRNNVFVIVAAISPYRDIRQEVREKIRNFIEVYVNCPLEICEQRDVKGLYGKVRSGILKQFTGVDAPYESPVNPDVECKTDQESVSESSQKILAKLHALNYINTTNYFVTNQ